MLAKRTFVAIALALTTGCTPAMPPDVAAELADKYLNCIPGSVAVWSSAAAADTANQWIGDTTASCPQLTVSQVPDAASADLIVGDAADSEGVCTLAARGPVAVDAVVPVFYSDNFDELVLTPKVLKAVLSGTITSWDDPAIVELNPDAGLVAEPIVVAGKVTSPGAWTSFATWMSRLDPTSWTATDPAPAGQDIALEEIGATEGLVALVPDSLASNQDLAVIGLVTDDNPDGFFPEDTNFATGATQMAPTGTATIVGAAVDPSVTPTAMDGVSDAAAPWQALVSIDAAVCSGANELPARALARNMLRHNAQGQLASLGLLVVSDTVLAASSAALAAGLPTPTTTPSSEDAVATDAPSPEESQAAEPDAATTDEPAVQDTPTPMASP